MGKLSNANPLETVAIPHRAASAAAPGTREARAVNGREHCHGTAPRAEDSRVECDYWSGGQLLIKPFSVTVVNWTPDHVWVSVPARRFYERAF